MVKLAAFGGMGGVLGPSALCLALSTALFAVGCGGGDATMDATASPTGTVGSGGAGGQVSQGGAGGQGGAGQGGAGGAATAHGPSASDLVGAGQVARSPGFKMLFTLGQPTQNQGKMSSPTFRVQGGFVGASGSLP